MIRSLLELDPEWFAFRPLIARLLMLVFLCHTATPLSASRALVLRHRDVIDHSATAPTSVADPHSAATPIRPVNSMLAPQSGGISLTTLATSFSNAVGIDYYAPANQLAVSVNYPTGQPRNLELIAADGTHTAFSNLAGLGSKLKLAAARDDGGGLSRGGFRAGELFTGTGTAGVIARISADGSSVQNPWVSLPGESAVVNALYVDRTGVYGGDLLAVTAQGNVWRVSASGAATLVASLGVAADAIVSVPNDASKYGPWAGRILAGIKSQSRINAISAQGVIESYQLTVSPADLDLIPANENLFAVDSGAASLLGAAAGQFTSMSGDLLVTQNQPGALWRIHWTGTEFQATQIAQATQLESVAFAPAGVFPLATTAGLAAVVRHAPSINGRVEGAVRQLTGEGVLFNSGAVITTDLMVPGTPQVVLNGTPTFGGTITGTGSAQPTGYQVTLNSGSTLGHLLTRVDAITLPTVATPPTGSGTRDVTINTPGQSPGDFATLRDLTLNSNVGMVAVPPGTYRNFTANSGSGFVIGVAGSTTPSVYNLRSLTLNGTTQIQVVGPVVLTLALGTSLNGVIGTPASALWLTFKVASGNVTLNSGSLLYGTVIAPSSTVIINGNSTLTGSLQCDRLTVNSGGLLRGAADATAPVIAIDQPSEGAVIDAAQTVVSGTVYDQTAITVTVNGVTATVTGNTYTATVPLAMGANTLTATATDLYGNTASAARHVTRATNQAPTVNAGSDQTISLPASAPLAGSASDDGLPTGSTLSVTWSKVSGPGTVTFANPNQAATTASFSAAGTYTLRLTASDGQLSSNDDVVITVTPQNQPPVVNAGADQAISFNLLQNPGNEQPLVSGEIPGWTEVTGTSWTQATAGSNGFPPSFQGTTYFYPGQVAQAEISQDVDLSAFASGIAAGTQQFVFGGYVRSFDESPADSSRIIVEYRDAANANVLASFDSSAIQSPSQWTLVADTRVAPVGTRWIRVRLIGVRNAGVNCDSYFDHLTLEAPTLAAPTLAAALLNGTASDDGLPVGSALATSWTKMSGPGTVTFAAIASPQTWATFDAPGTYVLRLNGSDSQLTASDDVQVTVTAINRAPVVNAGPDQAINLPALTVSLSGTATDDGLPAGSTLTTTWSKVSGPGTVSFADAAQLATTVTFDTPGTYVLRLTATDSDLTVSDDLVISINQAPTVNAGADQTITLPANATLNGTASDDGLPSGSTLTTTWSKVSGPGAVSFADAAQLATTASFAAAGAYVLRLTATDGALSSSDDMTVTVIPPNQAPTVNAGLDQTISLPASATLNGTATDDGLPAGSTLVVTWSKVSGPGTVTFANPAQAATTASFTAAGTYVLRLSATDSQLTASDDVTVTVNPAAIDLQGAHLTLSPANAGPNLICTPQTLTATLVDNANVPIPGVNIQFGVNGANPTGGGAVTDSAGMASFTYTASQGGTDTVQAIASSAGTQAQSNPSLITWTIFTRTIVLTDNFDSENGGRGTFSFNAFTKWNVTRGTVDLFGNGFVDFLPQNGLYVDMDGTSGQAGRLESRDTFSLAPGNYLLKFDMMGPGVGDANTMTVSLGSSFSEVFSLPVNSPYLTITRNITVATATNAKLVFDHAGGDFHGFVIDNIELTKLVRAGCYQANQAPAVNAGSDQTVTLPADVYLNGTVVDDGLPTGSSVSTVWSKASGPGTVTFSTPSSPTTMVTFSRPGVYTLRLTASDPELTSSDDVVITATGTNQPPSVDAGPDQTIDLPATQVTLNGTAVDDDLPLGSTLSVNWSKVSGPGTVTFSSPNQPVTTATFDAAGVYLLRLTASDSALTTSDDVAVYVATPCAQIPTGLVSWWPADGSANDLIGTNNGLLRNGVSFTTGLAGQAFHFDGVDDIVEIPDNPSLKPARVTTEAWVNFDSLNSSRASVAGLQYIIFKKNTRSAQYEGYTIFKFRSSGGDKLGFSASSASGTSASAVSTTSIVVGRWYHVVGIYDGSALKIYVNGSLEGSTPVSFPLNYDTRPVFIGGSGESNFDGRLNGLVDEARIYNRALSDSEVQAIFLANRNSLCRTANQPPVVNAGADQTITLPAGVSLNGTVSDDGLPAGSTLVVTWSKVSGPGSVTFASPTQAATTASFTAAGTYVLRLSATDSQLTASDDVTVTVNPAPVNQPPTVNAGADQMITLPNAASLQGTATDDGLPTGSTLSVTWSKVSGPGSVSFSNATGLTTTASFTAAGVYVLRLTASDSVLSSSDDVQVQVAAQNQAPTVNAGADQTISLPATASLSGAVSDDGLPAGSTLVAQWSKVSGPGTVTFANPAQAATTASFTAAGTYVLRLTATDGALSSSDDVQVTVNPAPVNQAPQVNAGPDQVAEIGTNLVINGGNEAALVNGEIPGWTEVTGASWTQATAGAGGFPAAQAGATYFYAGTTATAELSQDVDVRAYPAGTQFDFRAWLRSGNESPADSSQIILDYRNAANTQTIAHLTFEANTDPSAWQQANDLRALPAGTGYVRIRLIATRNSGTGNDGYFDAISLRAVGVAAARLQGTASDDGLPTGSSLGVQWSQVSGPGTAVFGASNQASTTATFTTAGTYVLRLTATDGALSTSDDVQVQVTAQNQAPTVNAGADQTVSIAATASLSGSVTDDGLPLGNQLAVQWSAVSGPGTVTFGNATQAATTASFTAAGVYVLRLTASDGEYSASDDVQVAVSANTINQAPQVSAGPDLSINLPTTQATLNGTATDDGLPTGSSLGVQWSQVSGPGTVTFLNAAQAVTQASFPATGVYVLRLTANDGALSTSDDVQVSVYDAVTGPPPTVSISSPADGDEVTAPANVVGSVDKGNWRLEYSLNRDSDATNQSWVLLASGNTPVSNASLAQLDPTLLLNGIYSIRLTSVDSSGQIGQTTIAVIVSRALKVGLFTLSFNDLSVPVAGLPMQVIRTYDSRDKRVGDFGVGWTLSLNNIRLEKSVNLGRFWNETVDNGLFPRFCLNPSRAHLVTVTFPDGKVYKFAAATSPQCQTIDAVRFATVSYVQQPGTAGTAGASLVAVGNNDVIVDGGIPGSVNLVGDSGLYNPRVFQMTTAEGLKYVIEEGVGLRSMTDLNGNTLTISSSGIIHSSGKSITFTRDTQGRITQISDPAGNVMTYTYDANGDLVTFKDRENQTTSFTYNNTHGLLTITDPRGITPIRNDYDSDGRLLSHTDAFGKTITYTHDIAARHEIIKDRLGNETLYEYDADGNVLRVTDALSHVMSYTYDSRDNKLSETNAIGKTTAYTYDANDNLTSVTDPLNNVTRYTYNALRQVLTVTDARNNVTTNTYTPKGQLETTTDALSHTTSYSYDAQGSPKTMTDALSQVTEYQCDLLGNLRQETDAAGHVTSYNYDANQNRTSQTTTRTLANGSTETLVTAYEYDHLNRPVKTTYPDGTFTQMSYNQIGQQATTTDQLGRVTSYTYDDMGRLTKTAYPDGTSEETTYDAEGRRLTSKDRAGRVTSFTYDAVGRLTKTTYADGTFTQTGYDAIGRVSTTTDARGNVTTYEYDAANRRTKVIDALTHQMTFAYDANGNQTSMTDANNHTTGYEYDALNRRVKVTYADSTFDQTGYDVLGRVSSKTDQAGKTTQYGYDSLGRLTSVTDALNQVTRYGYDELGNQISQTDALNRVTRYEYDKLGRRIKRTLPLGQVESYGYNAAGNLTSRTDFRGKTTTYGYDLLNRLLSKTPDASLSEPAVSFTYSATGRRLTMSDASGTTNYSYDVRDRLLSKQAPQGTLTYTYDNGGNLLTLSSNRADGVNTNYGYDALNRLSTVTDNAPTTGTRPATGVTSYSYDAAGNLSGYLYPNQVQTAYTYNALNRLTSMSVTKDAATLASYAYMLGAAGNRQSVTEQSGRSVSYSYDALYRLTSETISNDTVSANNGAISYTYDAVGNRLSRTSTVAAVPSTTSSVDANDRLASDSYDSNGNTIGAAGNSYQYDSENRLVALNAGTPNEVRYVYDGDGNRVAKTAGTGASAVTTTYLVDTLNPTGYAQVVEEITGGSVQRVYVLGLMRVSQQQRVSGSWIASWYGLDGHGSVRQLIDSSGSVTDTYTYDAFGILINRTGSTANDYLYAGEQADAALGMYYLRARYLNPASGRFWTMDSFEGINVDPLSLHKYLYSAANATNKIDPSGHLSFADFALYGSLISVLSALAFITVNMLTPSQRITIDDEPVVVDESGWTEAVAEYVHSNAATFWRLNADIVVRSKPVRTVHSDKLRHLKLKDDLSGNEMARYLEGILDEIKPAITAKHVTVFTDIDTFGTEGFSSPGVFPGGRYSGTGISVISSGTLHPSYIVTAHEWGHTFGILSHFYELIPNIMNSFIAGPSLTPTQRRIARDYVAGHYH
jgi:RHS repeat-associated protein